MKPPLILEAVTVADKPPVFMPVTEDRLAQEAWIHALRSNADAIERLAQSSERRDEQHAEMVKTLAGIETRLSVIEAGTLEKWVQDINQRLAVVEADQLRRQGREGVWAAILRSPIVAWLTTLGTAIGAVFVLMKEGGGQ